MEGTKENRRTIPGSWRSGRIAAYGGAGGALAIAWMMALAPAGMAAKPHATLSPPFGAADYPFGTTGFAGCGGAKMLAAPSWSNANGKVSVSEVAHADSSCSSSSANSGEGFVANGIVVYWPITFGAGPTHQVILKAHDSENWSLSVAVSGTCPSTMYTYSWGTVFYGTCDATSYVNYNSNWFVADLTDGSFYPGSSGSAAGPAFFVENSQTINWGCYSPAFGGACWSYNSSYWTPHASLSQPTFKFADTGWVNGTFNTSHNFAFVWEGTTYLYADVSGWSTASAKASLNIASHGNGFWVNSITAT